MPSSNRIRFILATTAIALAACTDSANMVAPPAPQLTAAATLGTHSPGSSQIVMAQSEDELKRLLDAENARIAALHKRTRQTYDSLKVEWDRYRRNPTASQLIKCEPLKYAAETKIIGPEGGEIGIGPHKLSIPRGALRAYVVITGEAPTSFFVSVKLSPHGLTFNGTPKLTLSYKHCDRPRGLTERVAYVSEALRILEWPRSKDYDYEEVAAWIGHFSSYMVAY